jgi:arylsulfatase A-like enzyme
MHKFFFRLVLLLALFFCSNLVFAEKKSDARPNIVYCLADDWAWPHAGVYGDPVIKTPNFDRVARNGMLFTRAYSAAPSCTPSRAAMLTGRAIHQLKEGANLWGFLPREFPVYPNILEKAGYAVGFCKKGWGPGNFEAGGRTRNPAGAQFKDFAKFLEKTGTNQPFCFWYGSHEPHRPYEEGLGKKLGMKIEDVIVPPFWPDTPEVRSDILDYYAEVQQFDGQLGEVLSLLEKNGLLDNTLVVVSGDNGSPFPRGKANLYDAGSHQPLAISWPKKFRGGKSSDAFVNLYDLAPTFLEAAGLKPPKEMTGRSLLGLLEGKSQPDRDKVFVERERHANCRKGDLSYPSRAIRTKDFLYIRNLLPDRWPTGDPEKWVSVGPFGDCDASPTKDFILDHREQPELKNFFQLSFAKRPAEELYDLAHDPHELVNVADKPEFAKTKKKLRAELDKWMRETGDPRAFHDGEGWDKTAYFGK